MRCSRAAPCGEARLVASARLGSARSRTAAPRRRIRLEARAEAKAPIHPHCSVQNSSPTSLWKLWKTCGIAGAWASRRVRRLYDAWPGAEGRRAENPRKEREFSAVGWPSPGLGMAGRWAHGSRASRKLTADPEIQFARTRRSKQGGVVSSFPAHQGRLEPVFYCPVCAEREFKW